MVHGGRVGGVEYAERVNEAAGLVAAGVPVAEAARVLAGRFSCSQRQARRYVEVAARSGAVVVPEPATVFTVKVPTGLAQRVRAHARASGRSISAVVTQALEEFLARGSRNHPRR
jgi:Ribbon-helix-helix protein, copG family